MSGVLDRLVAAFVVPAEQQRCTLDRRIDPAPPELATVAVLAPPERAMAAGAAVALGLANGVAVLAVWGIPATGPRAPSPPRARRLATKLVARGHDALATGRLVVVTLGAGPEESARVASAAGAPVVLVVAGPRDEHVDRVLRDHDHVLVVSHPLDAGHDLVATLALESLRRLGAPAGTLVLPDVAAARLLAAAGVALVTPWRAPVQEAIA